METTLVYDTIRGPMINNQGSGLLVGSFSLTIPVATVGNKSTSSPLP